MKKIIVIMLALAMLFSLAGCFGMGTANNASSTADQAEAADVSTYDKDFDGLVKYVTDRNSNAAKNEIFYDILGAKNGTRLVLNGNAYVEIYEFDEEENDASSKIFDSIRNNEGKFSPMENGTEMTAKITDSGRYILAWDATRSYDYDKNVATEELLANW